MDVVAEAVVVIVGDVAAVAVLDLAGSLAEGVPDRRAAAVGCGGTFNLITGRGHAPFKSGRKLIRHLRVQFSAKMFIRRYGKGGEMRWQMEGRFILEPGET